MSILFYTDERPSTLPAACAPVAVYGAPIVPPAIADQHTNWLGVTPGRDGEGLAVSPIAGMRGAHSVHSQQELKQINGTNGFRVVDATKGANGGVPPRGRPN